MERAIGTPLVSALAKAKRGTARAALVSLQDSSRTLLSDCFRQFGIEPVPVKANAAERLRKEKFEACVSYLTPATEPILAAARSSPSNSRLVLYALGGSAQDAMRFSKYGINAMFPEPLERPAAVNLLRGTHNLLLHEFRRYARIPIVSEVTVIGKDGRRFSAASSDVSSGGMSLKSPEEILAGSPVEISFALLSLPRVNLRAAVTWSKSKSMGLRFDPCDERRHIVKGWIDRYLER